MNLNGPLAAIDATGAGRWTLSGLVLSKINPVTVAAGAGPPGLDTNGNTAPLVFFTGAQLGGPHLLADGPGLAMFDLRGSNTIGETDPDTLNAGAGSGLTVGADQPLRHAAELFRANGTAVQTNQFLAVDTALVQATRPLADLVASSITSASDLIRLGPQAKLTVGTISVPADALVLNGSSLTVTAGSLASLAGGSFMNVNGNLVSLLNGSALSILAGGLVTVSGGSVFKLAGGSLGFFGTGTNTLNIPSTPCSGGCSLVTNIPNFGGFPVLLKNGGQASNVIVDPSFIPFRNLGGPNQVTLGPSAAVLVVDGATSKVRLSP